MTNLDGQCQAGPEGEKYPKTTRTGKATKKQKGSLDESCESLIVGAADVREERERKTDLALKRLQRIKNSLARVVLRVQLHWLPTQSINQFRLLKYVMKLMFPEKALVRRKFIKAFDSLRRDILLKAINEIIQKVYPVVLQT